MLGTLARIELRAQDDAGLLGAAIEQIYTRQPRVTLHSGQTLVGDNLDVLQDAVESIIAAFLLPSKVSGGGAARTFAAVGRGRVCVGGIHQ